MFPARTLLQPHDVITQGNQDLLKREIKALIPNKSDKTGLKGLIPVPA